MKFGMFLTKAVVVVCLSAVVLVAGACADGNGTPISPTTSGAAVTPAAPGTRSTPGQAPSVSERSGDLRVTKECSPPGFTGQAGSFCTITSSNVKEIEVGSRVFYAQAAGATALDSDVVLDLPGNGNNRAFGHCELVFATGTGLCTFTGGTGKFTHLYATAGVSYLGGVDWAWTGSYRMSPRD
jgi:hypothetical protein